MKDCILVDGLHLSGKGAAVRAEGLSGAVASGLGKVRYLNYSWAGGMSRMTIGGPKDRRSKKIQRNTSESGIKCVCLNARSIINQKTELNIMVDDIKPHIIGTSKEPVCPRVELLFKIIIIRFWFVESVDSPLPSPPLPHLPSLPPSLPPSPVPNLIKLGPAVWPKLQPAEARECSAALAISEWTRRLSAMLIIARRKMLF